MMQMSKTRRATDEHESEGVPEKWRLYASTPAPC